MVYSQDGVSIFSILLPPAPVCLSRYACPFPAVLVCLFCPAQPVQSGSLDLSVCSACPVLPVLFSLSCSANNYLLVPVHDVMYSKV
jgi:hypothetical protein